MVAPRRIVGTALVLVFLAAVYALDVHEIGLEGVANWSWSTVPMESEAQPVRGSVLAAAGADNLAMSAAATIAPLPRPVDMTCVTVDSGPIGCFSQCSPEHLETILPAVRVAVFTLIFDEPGRKVEMWLRHHIVTLNVPPADLFIHQFDCSPEFIPIYHELYHRYKVPLANIQVRRVQEDCGSRIMDNVKSCGRKLWSFSFS
jgi:hypothetical protein